VDDKQFWDILSAACDPAESPEEWHEPLHEQLIRLPPREIVHFDWLFDAKTAAAYTVDLWGAAYLINGGASDDGFYYFRCWLVGMGKKVYEAALANPDSLADFVKADEEAEAEIYGAGRQAWYEATNQPDTTPLDDAWLGPRPTEVLQGQDWDYDDDAEMRRRFPRLTAVCIPDEDEE
jgi:hypothetical protein